MSIDSDDAWIAIEELPLDLQARCAWSTEDREHPEGRVYRITSGWVKLGCIGLFIGVVHALFSSRTPAFGSFFRAGLLISGLAFAGVWVAQRRMRRFLGIEGQRLVVGPTCLVVVDAEAVRILPAEQLALTSHSVGIVGGQLIDTGSHSQVWRADLERAQAAAADPAAKEADRFRAVAARAKPWKASHVRWTRRLPALVAGLAGVLVAFSLEAGPLHSRAMSGAGAEQRAERFLLEVKNKATYREDVAHEIKRDVEAAAKSLVRDKLLAEATQGKEADLRAFLRKADPDDPARPDIVGRLTALCATKFPVKGLGGLARLNRLLDGIVCLSPQGASFTFTYNDPASKISSGSAQKVADDLTAQLKDSSFATANHSYSPPKGEPYLELKLTKEGSFVSATMSVQVVATVRDARGVASEPYTYSTRISDPSYTPPPPKESDFNDTSRDVYSCPSGTTTCGYGATGWCCPLGSTCYGYRQCAKYRY